MPDGRNSDSRSCVDRARASYSRCRDHEDFIPRFYQRLWALEPNVRERFAHTDMDRQHEVMREAINSLLMYARGSAVAKMAIDRLAQLHSRTANAVPPEHYDAFVQALVDVVAEVDPQADDELIECWRVGLRPGLARIIAAY